jgi:hypothetical protein
MPTGEPANRSEALSDQTTADPAQTGIDQLLAGSPQRVGRFEYRYDTDTWTWSDTVAQIHGYKSAQAVTPTTDVVLGHKHPDDLAEVRTRLLGEPAAPFSSRHRIITTTGQTRNVVVVGDAVVDDDGQVVATRGFYIDITPGFTAEVHQAVNQTVQVVLEHRQIIDMAKGMLMVTYRISADAAFGVLKWRSQELNIKLFKVAEKVVAELPEVMNVSAETTTTVNHYLMTLKP